MSYIITCPICGPRDSYEFKFGSEEKGPRPAEEGLSDEAYCDYVHMHLHPGGPQKEWWFHRDGCGVWFTTWRDTWTVREVAAPEEETL
jgi:sarcosine oxidase subunit delta